MTDRQPPKPDPVRGIEWRLRRAADGTWTWKPRVRWKDPRTGRRLVEELDTLQDALDFQAHLRLARRRGVLEDLDRGRITLDDYAQEWWTRYAATNLERSTLESYAHAWNRHLQPRIGHLELRQITPSVVAKLRERLERDGAGAPTTRRAMAILQSMLREAVVWGHIDQNPVRAVRKPTVKRQLAIRPVPPELVEDFRATMPTDRDALLVSVLAYAGLRPEEALALTWGHVGKASILVERRVVRGEIVHGLKSKSRPPRNVTLTAALRHDLNTHRLQAGRPSDEQLIFARPDGAAWLDHDWRNWRSRTYQPRARRLGLSSRPYDLRHSFASLLLRDPDLTLAEVAEQLGHSVATLSEHYAHVIAELKGAPPASVDQQINDARAAGRHRSTG